MQYLRGMRTLPLNIEYAVHQGIKSHTVISMSLGNGATYSPSCKQRLNTKSAAEEELVAMDDVMGEVLWTRHFLAAQGQYTLNIKFIRIEKAHFYWSNKLLTKWAEKVSKTRRKNGKTERK